jgi:hypothetical protein
MKTFYEWTEMANSIPSLAAALVAQHKHDTNMDPSMFRVGDKVEINDDLRDFWGTEAIVTGFEKNMFGRSLILVKREGGSGRELSFYPHELKVKK